jgi:hypothetical protein
MAVGGRVVKTRAPHLIRTCFQDARSTRKIRMAKTRGWRRPRSN